VSVVHFPERSKAFEMRRRSRQRKVNSVIMIIGPPSSPWSAFPRAFGSSFTWSNNDEVSREKNENLDSIEMAE